MLKALTLNRLWIFDVQGKKREVNRLPLPKRLRFVELLELLSDRTSDVPPDTDLRTLYDSDRLFQVAADEALLLFGLKAKWLSAHHLVSLLFSHEDGPGLLQQLEFPPTTKQGTPLEEGQDPYAHAVASVWSFMPNNPLADVLAVVDSMPWSELEGILEARNEQAIASDPQAKSDREWEKKSKVLAEQMQRDISSGAMFSPPSGSLRDLIPAR